MDKKPCPYCGELKKNVGAHKRHCKKRQSTNEYCVDVLVDDYIEEKPLSSIISEIKQILKQYQKQITVTTTERNGTTEEIEIIARIQVRR
jgi:hypothetical protein